MSRLFPAVLLALTLFSSSTASAQWFSSSDCGQKPNWWTRYWSGWKENNIWPQQWVGYDRQAVCVPLNMQAEKGWHRMNLIGSFHFDPATNRLNAAGERKVWYVLTQQLPERRTIFVEKGATADETTARMDAVQTVAARMLPVGELPQVAESNMILEGWPASDVDATLRGFESTRPAPRLPAASSEASNAGENSP